MALTTLPSPPQRSDPANFAARGDAFMAALPTFVSEFNAQVPNVVAGDQGITGNLTVNGNSTLGNATTDVITIGVNGIVKDASGNVGIGTATPNGPLMVASAASSIADFHRNVDVSVSGPAGCSIGLSARVGSTVTRSVEISGGLESSTSGFLTIGTRGSSGIAERMRIDAVGSVSAGADNTQTLGTAAKRWSVVYAGTGTINTSDAREKTELQQFTNNEIKAAILLSKAVGTYKWLDQVNNTQEPALKQIGTTVQKAIAVMQSCELDPFDYGFICHDTWEATETEPAGDRYGFRYDQLNMFIAAGISARLDALEAKAV